MANNDEEVFCHECGTLMKRVDWRPINKGAVLEERFSCNNPECVYSRTPFIRFVGLDAPKANTSTIENIISDISGLEDHYRNESKKKGLSPKKTSYLKGKAEGINEAKARISVYCGGRA